MLEEGYSNFTQAGKLFATSNNVRLMLMHFMMSQEKRINYSRMTRCTGIMAESTVLLPPP